MLRLDPRLLATTAGLVLVGGIGVAATSEPGPRDETTSSPDADPEVDTGADADAPASSGPANGAGEPGDDETAGDDGDGQNGSMTDRTLEQMRDRDMSDAIETYQDADGRD